MVESKSFKEPISECVIIAPVVIHVNDMELSANAESSESGSLESMTIPRVCWVRSNITKAAFRIGSAVTVGELITLISCGSSTWANCKSGSILTDELGYRFKTMVSVIDFGERSIVIKTIDAEMSEKRNLAQLLSGPKADLTAVLDWTIEIGWKDVHASCKVLGRTLCCDAEDLRLAKSKGGNQFTLAVSHFELGATTLKTKLALVDYLSLSDNELTVGTFTVRVLLEELGNLQLLVQHLVDNSPASKEMSPIPERQLLDLTVSTNCPQVYESVQKCEEHDEWFNVMEAVMEENTIKFSDAVTLLSEYSTEFEAVANSSDQRSAGETSYSLAALDGLDPFHFSNLNVHSKSDDGLQIRVEMARIEVDSYLTINSTGAKINLNETDAHLSSQEITGIVGGNQCFRISSTTSLNIERSTTGDLGLNIKCSDVHTCLSPELFTTLDRISSAVAAWTVMNEGEEQSLKVSSIKLDVEVKAKADAAVSIIDSARFKLPSIDACGLVGLSGVLDCISKTWAPSVSNPLAVGASMVSGIPVVRTVTRSGGKLYDMVLIPVGAINMDTVSVMKKAFQDVYKKWSKSTAGRPRIIAVANNEEQGQLQVIPVWTDGD